MQEKVSIIMSVFNEPLKYLILALESIINQDYQDMEYIIVMDSPNNIEARNYLINYAKNDSRIKLVINDQNIGLTKSLNKAIELASGSYIARMDADDISLSDRISKEMQYLRENNLDLVGCETERIDENGNVIMRKTNKSFQPECIKELLKVADCIPHPTWLVKREVYRELQGYREISTCEDYDFLLRCIKKGFRVGICDQILFKYRINNTGISRTNALQQKLSADYLNTNFDYILEISQEDIDAYLKRKINQKSSIKYLEALKLLNKGNMLLKKRNVFGCVYIMQALIHSMHIWKNIFDMVKIRMIRLKYKIL